MNEKWNNNKTSKARKNTNKIRKVFTSDDFVDVDLNEAPTNKLKNVNIDIKPRRSTISASNSPYTSRIGGINSSSSFHIHSRKAKSDLIDKIIVKKITSETSLHRRAKSQVDILKLSSYNYRVDNENNNNNNNSTLSISKLKPITEIVDNLSLDDKHIEHNKLFLNKNHDKPFSNDTSDRKCKLEAETKAKLISEIGAIGLPMNDRPEGLPPKPKEELEYQKKLYESMIKSNKMRLDHETETIVNKTIRNDNRETKISHDSIFWHTLANCNNFNEEISRNSVRKKITKGLPSFIRGKIWRRFAMSKLSIAWEVFDEFFNDKSSPCNSNYKISVENKEADNSTIHAIKIDVERTLPSLKLFQSEHPMHKDLCQLLYVFHSYNSNVGYTQGMTYPMAIFLLNLDPYDCFVCFNNLINDPIFTAIYTCNTIKLDEIYIWFETILGLENDKLTSHIHRISLSPSMYILDWIMSGFCKIFTLETTSRIFDNYFIEGSIFFFKCAIMILNYHDKQILSSNDPIYCAQLLTKPLNHPDEDVFFKRISQINDYSYMYNQLELFLKVS